MEVVAFFWERWFGTILGQNTSTNFKGLMPNLDLQGVENALEQY